MVKLRPFCTQACAFEFEFLLYYKIGAVSHLLPYALSLIHSFHHSLAFLFLHGWNLYEEQECTPSSTCDD